MSRLAFQVKCLIFYGRCSFQIAFQSFLLAMPLEHSAMSDFFCSSSTKVYTLFTVNFPLFFFGPNQPVTGAGCAQGNAQYRIPIFREKPLAK